MKVYTYYSHVDELDPEHEVKLILLWKRTWAKCGYEPVVIGESHARSSRDYEEFNKRITLLPSINPSGYDRACYLRWLAMAQIGGLMTDYDVMLYDQNWKPRKSQEGFVSYQRHVPAVVYGTGKQYQQMVDAIMSYRAGSEDIENGKPHVSDMMILLRTGIPWKAVDLVKMYEEQEWMNAPLVHYSTGALAPAGKLPRFKHIPGLR